MLCLRNLSLFLLPMRFLVSLFFVGCLGVVFLSGCDRPESDAANYGEIIDRLPDIPEAKELFEIPQDIEGVDVENIMRRRY